MLLRRPDTTSVEITVPVAKTIGLYLGAHPDGADIVDAHVVMLARAHGLAVLTSDPRDLLALDPKLQHITV